MKIPNGNERGIDDCFDENIHIRMTQFTIDNREMIETKIRVFLIDYSLNNSLRKTNDDRLSVWSEKNDE